MQESLGGGRITLFSGDCLDVLGELPEASVDSVVTDPPYHLTSIVKRMSADNSKPVGFGSDGRFRRLSGGFMGKQWDGGDIAFRPELWAKVLRVLKPGGHLLAFGGTRTFARMSVAIEDSGFEIRDTIMWLYGSGFPKSHSVSKAIDRAAGAEREIVGRSVYGDGHIQNSAESIGYGGSDPAADKRNITAPATDAAKQWDGWGTALKPACEPIVLARKPLSEKTVAANVLAHGTGAINVDGCRVPAEKQTGWGGKAAGGDTWNEGNCGLAKGGEARPVNGRWPANVIHDGSEEVVGAFPESGPAKSGGMGGTDPGMWNGKRQCERGGHDDSGGSAARFFYTAKANKNDRIGSKHPTVKPVALIAYLIRLITPPGGVVLDPFAGSGTAGEAAIREGVRAVLIEREAEYQGDIRRRIELAIMGPEERQRALLRLKAANDNEAQGAGPLFGGAVA